MVTKAWCFEVKEDANERMDSAKFEIVDEIVPPLVSGSTLEEGSMVKGAV